MELTTAAIDEHINMVVRERRKCVLHGVDENNRDVNIDTLCMYLRESDDYPTLTPSTVYAMLSAHDRVLDLSKELDDITDVNEETINVTVPEDAQTEFESLLYASVAETPTPE